MTLRLPETEARYQADIVAGKTQSLQDVEPRREWKYWKLIPNKYPHDRLYAYHDLLIPKRMLATLRETKPKELEEYIEITTRALVDDYDCVFINFPSKQTIRTLFHAHLGVFKDEIK